MTTVPLLGSLRQSGQFICIGCDQFGNFYLTTTGPIPTSQVDVLANVSGSGVALILYLDILGGTYSYSTVNSVPDDASFVPVYGSTSGTASVITLDPITGVVTAGAFTTTIDFLLGVAGSPIPTGFIWPQTIYPIAVRQTGAYTFVINFVPEVYAAAALTGVQYYVNVNTGSDAANGLTPATAVKSIFKATQLGNAGGVPFQVSIAPGSYPRENNFTTTGTNVPNTQPAAFIASGPGVECWAGSTLTWPVTPDPTFTNTYSLSRSSVARVINIGATDANGDYAELIKVADATTCNTTPNSWAQVTTTLYVHRPLADAPTNLNTRVLLLSTPNLVTATTSKDLYIYGIDFQGGNSSPVFLGATATLNFMAVNCSAKFGGSVTDAANGFRLDNVTGLAALVNCAASCNEADGINTHWTPGGIPQLYTLTINCKGYNNGRDTVQSCNGLTAHDNCISIDVMGEYFGNYGANVIPINGNQMWCLGTYAHDSLGDVSHGGTTVPTDYQTQSTAVMYLQNCRSAVSTISLSAANTSIIKTRNFLPGVGQTPGAGGGTITTF